MDTATLLRDQMDYYRARADEYDDWWFRRGRFDHGDAANGRWRRDTRELEAALEQFRPQGHVLELACGTGIWTQQLAGYSTRLTAVDSARSALAHVRRRAPLASLVHADIFDWVPRQKYDVCFFSFWLSHVPQDRFAVFWEKVSSLLAPGGRVFFIDSARSALGTAKDQVLPRQNEETMCRRLDDGRRYRIVKRFYDTEALAQQLADLGWMASLGKTSEFFIYGDGVPRV